MAVHFNHSLAGRGAMGLGGPRKTRPAMRSMNVNQLPPGMEKALEGLKGRTRSLDPGFAGKLAPFMGGHAMPQGQPFMGGGMLGGGPPQSYQPYDPYGGGPGAGGIGPAGLTDFSGGQDGPMPQMQPQPAQHPMLPGMQGIGAGAMNPAIMALIKSMQMRGSGQAQRPPWEGVMRSGGVSGNAVRPGQMRMF